MTQAYQDLLARVEQINQTHHLEIDLKYIAEIYGDDIVAAIGEDPADFEEKIQWLLMRGFSDTVSDICNRFGILFVESSEFFCAQFDKLIERLGDNYADQIAEDLSLIEALM